MNRKMILYILGKVILVGALLMALPIAVTLIYKENTFLDFAAPILGLAVIGAILSLKKPKDEAIHAKEGLFIVALSWIILSVFGALPFYLSGQIPSFMDCIFETVSGFTTTGASILTNVECLPYSLLFWRSFTHWVGGMGVLVFVLAILPQSDSHSVYLMRAEVPGPQVGKLVAKIKVTVRILYGIYIVMTLIEILLLILGGMPTFDSIVHSFATAGTGGFSIKNASIAFYDSTYIDTVVSIFMVLFGINFNIFYLILAGNIVQALKSDELRWYLSIIAISIILITINIMPLYPDLFQSMRYAFFQVSSIITTTGFATTDFNIWPNFSKAILLLLMFLGACAGSTGGGIKISRIVILFKSAIVEIKHTIFPRSVNSVKFEGHALDSDVVSGVNIFLTVFMMITSLSILILSLDNISLITAFSAVAACINNVGPGLDIVGPIGNYSSLSLLSKIVLTFDMLAGRLELFPILMLFSPSAWRGR